MADVVADRQSDQRKEPASQPKTGAGPEEVSLEDIKRTRLANAITGLSETLSTPTQALNRESHWNGTALDAVRSVANALSAAIGVSSDGSRSTFDRESRDLVNFVAGAIRSIGKALPKPAITLPRELSEEDKGTIEEIASAVRENKCILFLGSGAHYHAPPHLAGKYLYGPEKRPPVGQELARLLATECDFESIFPSADGANLQRVSMWFELQKGRHELIKRLRKLLMVGKEPSPILRTLAELDFPLIVTTNFDDLFERALSRAGKSVRKIHYRKDKERTDQFHEDDLSAAFPVVFKLHGDLLDSSESVVITDEDYIRFILL